MRSSAKENEVASVAERLAGQIATKRSAADDVVVEETVEPDEVDEVEDDEELEGADTEDGEDQDEESELPTKVKDILRKNRQALREAQCRADVAEKKLKTSSAEGDDTQAAPSAEDTKFKTLYTRTAVKAAIAEAGGTKHADKLARLIDLDTLDIDDDGNIEGLKDAVEALKEEFEELFAEQAPRRTRPAGGAAAGGRKPAPSKPLSSAEKLAARYGG